ncbi:hypothetical protein K4K54_005504, partial [Colletotrichum sp. SAR 10_86]
DGKDAAEKTGEASKSDEAPKADETVESKAEEAKVEEPKPEESKATGTTVDNEKPKDDSGVELGSEPKEVGSTAEKKE